MRMRYLLSLAMVFIACSTSFSQLTEPEKPQSKGQLVYNEYCVSCHQIDGLGVPNMSPPLSQTSYITGDKKVLINILLKGMSQQEIDGETYHNVMPPFDYLTDKEIADVLTYVRSNFGNKAKPINESDVKAVRSGK